MALLSPSSLTTMISYSSSTSTPNNLLSPLSTTRFSKTRRDSTSISLPKTTNPNRLILQPIKSSTSADPSSAGESEREGESNPPSSRIFIKGLSRSTSEGCLVKVFSCFGDISKVKIITSKSSKESLGLAYIWFAREGDALLAVKEMDGKFVDGRFIAVMMARPEAPSKQVRTTPYSVAQLRPMCISQFVLANQACAILPTVESPMDQNNTRTPATVDNDDDDGDDDNDAEREHRHRHGSVNGHRQRHGNGNGHRQKHGSGHGHRQRREHGHGHGHGHVHREGPRAERDCCQWLDEVDEACVCTAMLRLPPFLIKPKHQYHIKMGDTCERTFKCHGI